MLVFVHALPKPTPPPNAVIAFLDPLDAMTRLHNAPAAKPAPTYKAPRSMRPFWIASDTFDSDFPLIMIIAERDNCQLQFFINASFLVVSSLTF